MRNSYFQFKQFTVNQNACAMKVTTDSCLFGAWCAAVLQQQNWEGSAALDIGTGTGLLSLMVAQKNKLDITALEIDAHAAHQAIENFKASPWSSMLSVQTGDILQQEEHKKYNIIICNPPFYENELQSPQVKKNVAHHSQFLNLKDLVKKISNLISSNGVFFLLIPYKRLEETKKLLDSNDIYIYEQVTVRPLLRQPPFRIMLKCGLQKKAHTNFSDMAVCIEKNVYSPEFISLLQDYYLYL